MLELRNISVTLEGDKDRVGILHDVSLFLEKKKVYVITGPNGGGKSSLAKAIMGIYRTTGGQILLDGEDISGMVIHERARMGIGYAFQQPPRFKGIKVRELLQMSAGLNMKVNPHGLLYDVGLCAQDYLDREINASFSGGELKRIEIASVLARDLKVAIFDEPEAGIDLWSFQRLTETFREMNEKRDTTIVIISHQERILQLADEVILVSGGEIAEITTHEKVLGDIRKLDEACLCREDCDRKGWADAGCN